MYEGVTRYTEIGDILVFFFSLFLSCSSFLIHRRLHHKNIVWRNRNCAVGFNSIVLCQSQNLLALPLSCVTKIKILEKGDGILSDFRNNNLQYQTIKFYISIVLILIFLINYCFLIQYSIFQFFKNISFIAEKFLS